MDKVRQSPSCIHLLSLSAVTFILAVIFPLPRPTLDRCPPSMLLPAIPLVFSRHAWACFFPPFACFFRAGLALARFPELPTFVSWVEAAVFRPGTLILSCRLDPLTGKAPAALQLRLLWIVLCWKSCLQVVESLVSARSRRPLCSCRQARTAVRLSMVRCVPEVNTR